MTVEPRSGLIYGWPLGDSTWSTDMDANLVRLGRFGVHLSVKGRFAVPPGSPAIGDSYIILGGTGAWAGRNGQIAVWDGTAWAFGTPRVGWLAYVEDEQRLTVFKTSWSTGVPI